MNVYAKILADAERSVEAQRKAYTPLKPAQLDGLHDALVTVSQTHARRTYAVSANGRSAWQVVRTVQRPTERIAVANILQDARTPDNILRLRDTNGALHFYEARTPRFAILRVHGERLCAKCGTWHERDAFYANASRHDGLDPYCKSCRRAINASARRAA